MTAQVARAAGPAMAKAVRDVALQSSGVLQGQILDTQGTPQGGVEVAAVQHGQALAVTRTDADGRFTMASLRGGVYELQTSTSSEVVRLWAPQTAPPAAQDGLLLVAGNDVVRTQGHGLGFLANPWVLAGIVAAAIAIPLAVSDSDDGS